MVGGTDVPESGGFRGEVLEVLGKIRAAVRALALERGCEPGEFHATMLGAVLGPGWGWFAQVGDGCWVAEHGGVLGCLTWPTGGEFASQTVFALSPSAPGVLQCVEAGPGLRAVAGFTDGVERIALQLAHQVPEPGFFGPLFGMVGGGGTGGETGLEGELGGFLASERVCAESDDDKTLVVLVRRHDAV